MNDHGFTEFEPVWVRIKTGWKRGVVLRQRHRKASGDGPRAIELRVALLAKKDLEPATMQAMDWWAGHRRYKGAWKEPADLAHRDPRLRGLDRPEKEVSA